MFNHTLSDLIKKDAQEIKDLINECKKEIAEIKVLLDRIEKNTEIKKDKT